MMYRRKLLLHALEVRAVPATFTVMNLNDNGSDSLRGCIAQADALAGADTIEFQSGLTGTITLTTGELLPNQALTIVGPGSATLTIDGNKSKRVFNLSLIPTGDKANISGLTMTGGSSLTSVTGNGGAIFIGDESVTLTDCVIVGNTGGSLGGGIYAQTSNASLNLNNCLVTNNTSVDNGGGIHISSGSLSVLSSKISKNSSSYGAGLSSFGPAAITIKSSTVSDNTASGHGGGIAVTTASSVLVENSSVTGNTSSTVGGGIYIGGGAGTRLIINSTVSGNQSGSGGGIGIFSGTLTIQNSTIVLNQASSGAGGGIARSGSGTISLESSIVSGNINATAPDISSSYLVNVKTSAIGSESGFTLTNLGGNLTSGANLKLGSLKNNGGPTLTHLPATDSPLIDAGSNPALLTVDQRGHPRVHSTAADIGSVEFDTIQVIGITRNAPTPSSQVTVPWGVTLSDPVTGLSAANFTLSGSGAMGASIANVTGSGSSWTVTAITGVDGDLQLDLVNDNGLDRDISNLPFFGDSFTIDRTAPTVVLTANPASINDYKIGSNMLTLSATFVEPMDPNSTPAFDFPVENPDLSFGLTSASWTSSTVYQAKFNSFDLNVNLFDIDVRVTGGKDVAGNVFGQQTTVDLIDLDTQNPIVALMTRNDPTLNNLPTVGWTVIFSEPVTGVNAGNFSLFNGGLGGVPTVTSVTGGGTTWTVKASGYAGEGNLALYVTGTSGVTDASGNPLAGLPVIGPHYAIDPIPPSVIDVQINDDSVQRSRVTSVSVKFIEIVSFIGAPVNAFTLTGPNGAVTLAVDTSGSSPIQTLAKLTFSGTTTTDFTSLKDGRYTLKVSGTLVTDLAGTPLDGDGNGIGGDDYVLASASLPNPPTNIFRFFGDANGDGGVFANDFMVFRQFFNGVNPIFDFDNDGSVSGNDFTQFRSRFNGSI